MDEHITYTWRQLAEKIAALPQDKQDSPILVELSDGEVQHLYFADIHGGMGIIDDANTQHDPTDRLIGSSEDGHVLIGTTLMYIASDRPIPNHDSSDGPGFQIHRECDDDIVV